MRLWHMGDQIIIRHLDYDYLLRYLLNKASHLLFLHKLAIIASMHAISS